MVVGTFRESRHSRVNLAEPFDSSAVFNSETSTPSRSIGIAAQRTLLPPSFQTRQATRLCLRLNFRWRCWVSLARRLWLLNRQGFASEGYYVSCREDLEVFECGVCHGFRTSAFAAELVCGAFKGKDEVEWHGGTTWRTDKDNRRGVVAAIHEP